MKASPLFVTAGVFECTQGARWLQNNNNNTKMSKMVNRNDNTTAPCIMWPILTCHSASILAVLFNHISDIKHRNDTISVKK